MKKWKCSHLVLDILDKGFEFFFELPANPRARHYAGKINGKHAFVLDGLQGVFIIIKCGA